MSTINFSHLKLLAIFTVVVEAGSFAAAARKLKSSRSRVSEQIANLEADLGIRLLQRSTRKLRVSHEGLDIYQQAKQLPNILQRIEAIAKPASPTGRVSITLNHDIAIKFLLPVLAKFEQQYPDIQLDLVLNDARVDIIEENIDLAIRIGVPKDESLIARVMHEERMALFASPTYLKKVAMPKSHEALANCRWVILNQTNHTDVQHLHQNQQAIEIKPKHFTRCNSPLTMQNMLIQGMGIGSLLPTTVKAELANGSLVPVLPSVTGEPLVFSLVYPSRRQVPARTRALIDFLLNEKIFN